MLAAARHVSPAHAALKNGEWKRSQVHRHRALREDRRHRRPRPDRRARRAAALGVRHERDRLRPLRPGRPGRPDGRPPGRPRHPARRVRLHVGAPAQDARDRRPDRRRAAAPRSSRRLVLVNAARGGIVDEAALYAALKEGRIAAAGLDVFATEPCTDSPLFELENVVATPHLGASTDEAQEKAGIAVARSVRLALSGELVPDAVNVQGGVIAEDVRPGIPLTEKLGRIFTGLAGEVAQQIDVEVRGEITEYDVKVLELAALKGVFTDVVEDQVSYVNAPLLAAERGTAVRLITDAGEPRPPQPDHPARHARRRLAGLGQRHPGRHQPARAARRGQRLRRRHRADRPPRVPHATSTGPAWSAPSAGSSATPASTSPACRSPATSAGGQALVALSVDSAIARRARWPRSRPPSTPRRCAASTWPEGTPARRGALSAP